MVDSGCKPKKGLARSIVMKKRREKTLALSMAFTSDLPVGYIVGTETNTMSMLDPKDE